MVPKPLQLTNYFLNMTDGVEPHWIVKVKNPITYMAKWYNFYPSIECQLYGFDPSNKFW